MAKRATGSTRAPRVRVAIVDDHRLVLDGLSAKLAQPHHNIAMEAAETNWGALLEHPGFPFDVVVLDLHSNDNIPIGVKLRALGPTGTAAVVMSGHTDSASVDAALKAGALGFVPKTETADELISAIHAAASSRAHVTESIADRLASFGDSPDAGLGAQEFRALVLFAGGRTVREVGTAMGTTDETVKSYIKRGRRKFKKIGVDLGSRVLLRTHAVREGWIRPE